MERVGWSAEVGGLFVDIAVGEGGPMCRQCSWVVKAWMAGTCSWTWFAAARHAGGKEGGRDEGRVLPVLGAGVHCGLLEGDRSFLKLM